MRLLPVWIVLWGMSGKSRKVYFTPYHAEQFVRALRLNGTPCSVEDSFVVLVP